ncbi:uncharacterized protein CHSO_1446 [Chryseobacterium sp. StRB126]|nr:uncharacterized protein CHSO_1446 [Chryseobacterium sp. StRB126]
MATLIKLQEHNLLLLFLICSDTGANFNWEKGAISAQVLKNPYKYYYGDDILKCTKANAHQKCIQ